MRGTDERSGPLFSYVDLESRVPKDHPLRAIREIANGALSEARVRVDRFNFGPPVGFPVQFRVIGPDTKKVRDIAYQVREGNGEKGYFTRIGAAWPNKDGKGFNIQLAAVPLDGRITLRVPSEKPE